MIIKAKLIRRSVVKRYSNGKMVKAYRGSLFFNPKWCGATVSVITTAEYRRLKYDLRRAQTVIKAFRKATNEYSRT